MHVWPFFGIPHVRQRYAPFGFVIFGFKFMGFFGLGSGAPILRALRAPAEPKPSVQLLCRSTLGRPAPRGSRSGMRSSVVAPAHTSAVLSAVLANSKSRI